jgi:hypothetical protein
VHAGVPADIVFDMTRPSARTSVFPGFDAIGRQRHPLIDQLVTHRQAGGLSQADVARTMGTSQPAVARLEAGATDVRLSTITRYADAIGQDVTWTLRPSEEDAP